MVRVLTSWPIFSPRGIEDNNLYVYIGWTKFMYGLIQIFQRTFILMFEYTIRTIANEIYGQRV